MFLDNSTAEAIVFESTLKANEPATLFPALLLILFHEIQISTKKPNVRFVHKT